MLALYELVEAVAAHVAVNAVPDHAVADLDHISAVNNFLADYAVAHIIILQKGAAVSPLAVAKTVPRAAVAVEAG